VEILEEIGSILSELWNGVLVPTGAYLTDIVVSAYELVKPETLYGEGVMDAILVLLAYRLRGRIYGALRSIVGLVRMIPVVGPWLNIQGLKAEKFVIDAKDKVVGALSVPLNWARKIWSRVVKKDVELEAEVPAWKKK